LDCKVQDKYALAHTDINNRMNKHINGWNETNQLCGRISHNLYGKPDSLTSRR
jgi:hypothetical protein